MLQVRSKPMDWTIGHVDYTQSIEREFADYVCDMMVHESRALERNRHDDVSVEGYSCFSQLLEQFNRKTTHLSSDEYLFSAQAFKDRCLPSIIAELTMKTFNDRYGSAPGTLAVWPDQGPTPWPTEWPPSDDGYVSSPAKRKNRCASFCGGLCQMVKIMAMAVGGVVAGMVFFLDTKTEAGSFFSQPKTISEFNRLRLMFVGVVFVIYKLRNWISAASKADSRVQLMKLGPPSPCMHFLFTVNPVRDPSIDMPSISVRHFPPAVLVTPTISST